MYRGAQTTTLLGARGKGGKIKADRVNCPKNFVLHCRFSLEFCALCLKQIKPIVLHSSKPKDAMSQNC